MIFRIGIFFRKQTVFLILMTLFFCSIAAGAPLRVGFYSPSADTTEGWKNALMKSLPPAWTKSFKLNSLDPAELKKCDVVVIVGQHRGKSGGISDANTEELRKFVLSGGGAVTLHNACGFPIKTIPAIFPETASGIDNFHQDYKPNTREAMITCENPITRGFSGEHLTSSYYDILTLIPGAMGKVLVRRIERTPIGTSIGDPAFVVSEIGKGRHVASGFAVGLHASGLPVSPAGLERQLFCNAVLWAGKRLPAILQSVEIAKKGDPAGTRNLIMNASAEKKNLRGDVPLGWKFSLASGQFRSGITSEGAYSGKHAAFLEIEKFHGSTYEGIFHNYCNASIMPLYNQPVKADTLYEVTFAMKTDAPYIQPQMLFTNIAGKTTITPLSCGLLLVPKDKNWNMYQMSFRTGSDTHLATLQIRLTGRDKKWGNNLPVAPGMRLEVDDVKVFEKEGISSLDTLRQKATETVDVKWNKTPVGTPALTMSGPETGTVFNPDPEFLKSRYDNLPSNWQRIKLADNWISEKTQQASGKNILQRRNFTLPDLKKDQRVLLTVERGMYQTEVSVNGVPAGKHTGAKTRFSFDVTHLVKPGENTITLRGTDPEPYPYNHPLGNGFFFGARLDISDGPLVAKRTRLATDHRKNTVDAVIEMFKPEEKREIILSARVAAYKNPFAHGDFNFVKEITLGKFMISPENPTIKTKFNVPGTVSWSTSNPFLYTVEFVANGRIIGKERFGFRSFETRNGELLLNGVPQFLASMVFYFELHRFLSDRLDPESPGFVFVKKFLSAWKQLNVNTLYTMGIIHPTAMTELIDELGFMVYADFPTARYCRMDRKTGDGELTEMDEWVYENHNHPSYVMWSLGPELYNPHWPKECKSYEEILNPAYLRLKALDLQKRPVCNSSGRAIGSLTDLWDFHAYPGCINASWTKQRFLCNSQEDAMLRYFGNKQIPVIQFEAGGFGRLWNTNAKKSESAGFSADGDWNKEAYIQIVQHGLNEQGIRWLTTVYGYRNYLKDNAMTRRPGVGYMQTMTRDFLSMARTDPFLRGIAFACDVFSFVDFPLPGEKLPPNLWRDRLMFGREKVAPESVNFIASENAAQLKRSYAPVLFTMVMYPRNIFSGTIFTGPGKIVNTSGKTLNKVCIRTVILSADGKVLADCSGILEKPILNNSRLTVPLALPISETAAGVCSARMALFENGKQIAENEFPLTVFSRKEFEEPIHVGKTKIALYDQGMLRLGKNAQTTASVLKKLNIQYAELNDFSRLDNFDVLIVGAESRIPEQFGQIVASWLERGGKLLQFESSIPGGLPYLPQLSVICGEPSIVAEVITPSHPVFSGMGTKDFFIWNNNAPASGENCPGAVTATVIKPLNTAMLAVSGHNVPRNTLDCIGMALAEVRVGTGGVLVNSMECTARFGIDPAATRYLRNLLTYVISTSMPHAVALKSFKLPDVNKYNCALVNLQTSGKRVLLAKIPFLIATCQIEAGKTLKINLESNELFNAEYERKVEVTNHNEGGLSRNRASRIFIAHSPESGKAAGKYTILFKDGSKSTIEVRNCENIGKFARFAVSDGEISVMCWENPTPDKELDSLIAEGKDLALCGITLELIRNRLHQ